MIVWGKTWTTGPATDEFQRGNDRTVDENLGLLATLFSHSHLVLSYRVKLRESRSFGSKFLHHTGVVLNKY